MAEAADPSILSQEVSRETPGEDVPRLSTSDDQNPQISALSDSSNTETDETFTEPQIRLMRMQLSLRYCSQMAQVYVRSQLESETNVEWNEGELWNKWATKNLEKIKKCKFFEKLDMEKDSEGRSIPSLASMDITFIDHLIKLIGNKHAAYTKLRELRDKHSHSTITGIDQFHFDNYFAELFKITDDLFQKSKDLAEEWKRKFSWLKNNDFKQLVKEDNTLANKFQKELKNFILKTNATFTVPGSGKQLKLKDVSIYPSFKASKFSSTESAKKVSTENEKSSKIKQSSLTESDSEFVQDLPSASKSTSLLPKSLNSDLKDEDFDVEDEQDIDYESTDESELNVEDELYTPLDYDSMLDIIKSCVIGEKKERILIAAGGGRGKTLSSKKLMFEWANGKYLEEYYAVIRIDMKDVDCKKTLFDNMLHQYSGLQSQFQNELIVLQEIINQQQAKVLWLIDSLDESKDQTGTMRFIRESQSFYSQSAFIFLTRPEGKDILDLGDEEVIEFRIKDLNKEKVEELVNKFPFTKDSNGKRTQIINEFRASKNFFSWIKIPLYTVSYCALVDAGLLTQKIQTILDILFAIIAMALKEGELKLIQSKLKSDDIAEEEYRKQKKEIDEVNSVKDILQRNDQLLSALGRAVFICNEYSLHGFEDLKEKTLMSALSSASLSDNNIESLLRLSIFEQILDEQVMGKTSVFKFYHRNLRELILGYYLTNTQEPLEDPTKTRKLTDSVISAFRCTIAILHTQRKDEETVERVLKNVVKHVTGLGTEINDWRLSQIICELMMFAVISPEYLQIIAYILMEIFSLIEDSSRLSPLKQINPIPFLSHLRLHMDITLCKDCKIPKRIKLNLEKLQSLVLDPNHLNWPDINIFKIGRMLINTEDLLILALTEEGNHHLTEESPIIKIRAPVKTTTDLPVSISVPSPLPMTLIPNSSALSPEASFPGATDLIVVNLDDQIHVWSGEGEDRRPLYPKLVWRLHPHSNTWSKDETKGDVPPGLEGAAGLVVLGLLYFFGGLGGGRRRNEIYSYQGLSRRLKRLLCKGLTPSGRAWMCSWTDGRDCYFFGGWSDEPSALNLKGGERDSDNNTNQLVRFSPSTKRWADIDTKGPRPKPRRSAGCTAIKAKAYFLGGWDGSYWLDDLWCFDMKSSSWTEIIVISAAKPLPRSSMSLTAVSQRQLFLVGGFRVMGDTWLFDLETKEWSQMDELPAQEDETGIWAHGATLVGGSVFVVGGKRGGRRSSHVIKIRVSD